MPRLSMPRYDEFGTILNNYLTQIDRDASWLAKELGVKAASTAIRWQCGNNRPGSAARVIDIAEVLYKNGVKLDKEACEKLVVAAKYQVDDKISKRIQELFSGNQEREKKYRPPIQYPTRAPYFVGRTHEIVRILASLKPGGVFTIYGLHGVGKTALAAKIVEELTPQGEPPKQFPDGVLCIEMNKHECMDSIYQEIAEQLVGETKLEPRKAAKRALHGKSILIILDGFEHNNAKWKPDEITNLHQISPTWSVLQTSRRMYDSPSRSLKLGPLDLPEATDLLRDWNEKRTTNEPAVEEICRLIGCLPLAIKLIGCTLREKEAEEYLKILVSGPLSSVDELAETHGADRISRIIAISLSHIEQAAQDNLAQKILGVAGLLEFALFDRKAIMSAFNDEQNDVLFISRLDQLVDQGLLIRPSDEYRFANKLIHEYASTNCTKLIDDKSISINGILIRLASYYHAKYTAEPSEGLGQPSATFRHILSLIGYCEKWMLWESVLNLADTVYEQIELTGSEDARKFVLEAGVRSVQSLLQSGVKSFGAFDTRWLMAEWLRRQGNFYQDGGDDSTAIACYKKAIDYILTIKDWVLGGRIFRNLWGAIDDKGDWESTLKFLSESLTVAQSVGNTLAEVSILTGIGDILLRKATSNSWQADLETKQEALRESIDYYHQAENRARQCNDKPGEAIASGNSTSAQMALGNLQRAEEQAERALNIAIEHKDTRNEYKWRNNLGIIYQRQAEKEKDSQSAQTLYEQADKHHEIAFNIAHKHLQNSAEASQQLRHRQVILTRLNKPNEAKRYGKQANALDKASDSLLGRYTGLAISQIIHVKSEQFNMRQAKNYCLEIDNIEHAIEEQHAQLSIGAHKKQLSQIDHQDDSRYLLALIGIGDKYRLSWQMQSTITYYEQALSIAERLCDEHSSGLILRRLGSVYTFLGKLEEAIWYYDAALKLAESINDRRSEVICLCNLGRSYGNRGEIDEAKKSFLDALSIAEKIGHDSGEANALNELGFLYCDLGKYEQAKHHNKQAQKIAWRIGNSRIEIRALNGLGWIAYQCGEYNQCAEYYRAGLNLSIEIGSIEDEANARTGLGIASRALGDTGKAKFYYEQVLNIAHQIGDLWLRSVVVHNIGIILADEELWEASIKRFEESLSLARIIGTLSGQALSLWCLGDAYDKLGDIQAAQGKWQESLTIFEQIRSPKAAIVREKLK